MEKLLVVGIESVVGSNVALALADRFEVLGLYETDAVEFSGIRTAHCDAGDSDQLKLLARDFHPQWILHCGPLSASAWDLSTRRTASQGQAQPAKVLADLNEAIGSRLTVVTTDAVFAGPRMFHDEHAPTTATTAAGVHAQNLEGILQSTDALVVRTHAYGFGPIETQRSFGAEVWEALASQRAVELDGLRHATPILATDLAPMLLRAYERRLQGLYHLTGAERTSPLRFANELAAVCGFASPKIRTDHGAAPPETNEETSLASRRARRALELSMPMLHEGLIRFATQAEDGWRSRLTGGRIERLCSAAA